MKDNKKLHPLDEAQLDEVTGGVNRMYPNEKQEQAKSEKDLGADVLTVADVPTVGMRNLNNTMPPISRDKEIR